MAFYHPAVWHIELHSIPAIHDLIQFFLFSHLIARITLSNFTLDLLNKSRHSRVRFRKRTFPYLFSPFTIPQ